MKKDKLNSSLEYHFQLFIAGNEPNSIQAKKNIEEVCKSYLNNNYNLEIIDVFENYQAAIDHKIVVVPALKLKSTSINTTIIGSLDNAKILAKKLGLTHNNKRHE